MTDSCRKVSRGQVWYLVDNDVPLVHMQGSIQGKNRPWLVVSNNGCNQNSTVYTVVPLTTAAKVDLPTHVTFQTGDKTQTVLCEQIRSVSQQAFFNSGSCYKWTMSEKYMQMVDEALAVQLGLSLIFPKSEQFWESLERLIRVKVKDAIEHTQITALDVSKVASLLDAKVADAISTHAVPPPVEPDPEPVGRVVTAPSKKPRAKGTCWTTEEKEKFLEYYDKHGSKATAEAYNVKIGSVYGMRFKFFKELHGGNGT